MQNGTRLTFKKTERLCSKLQIERLFQGESESMAAFPIRMVYAWEEAPAGKVEVLVSVSKKHFHHAVDRNRVKRQIREAYRKNKVLLQDVLTDQPKALSLAFIWLGDKLVDSALVEKQMVQLLHRLADKLTLQFHETIG